MTKLAEACYSEYKSKWGEPGNQLRQEKYDGEMRIISLYDGFVKVFRFSDRVKAEDVAKMSVKIVENVNVGYSQNNGAYPRTSLLNELEKNNWEADKVGLCNCDCSSFVMTLCRYVGIDVDKNMYTGNEPEILMNTGEFIELSYSPQMQLKLGDILWRNGHTAVVCYEEEKFDLYTTGDVYMRDEPIDGTIIKTLKNGTGVKLKANYPWYYVTDGKNTGWVSGKYLK